MARARTAAKKKKTEEPEVTRESILKELQDMDGEPDDEDEDTYFMSVWSHRVEDEAFVRAFAWARKKGNELKACLIFADAHELAFEDSDTPVVKKD